MPRGFWPTLGIAFFILTIFTLSLANATWKPEYANQPQSVRDWYQNAELTPEAQKRFYFKKCCAQSETVKTQFKVDKSSGQDRWFWLADGKWLEVPQDIIHWDEHAPDGQATLFVLPGTTKPTCFYPPNGGL